MQLNIFEFTRPKYKITKPIRLIELFAGIGSQAKALKNIGADFTHYKVVEFDKYALASYNAVHNTNFETQDITLTSAEDLEIVETDKYDYIMTYSFPCQDLSLAGKGAGMKKGDNTRSGLLWEVEWLLEQLSGFKEKRVPPKNTTTHSMAEWVDDYNYDIDKTKLPQILLFENVPQVLSKAHLKDFLKWEEKLEKLGYSNYFKNLNAKDYTIPQTRNRTYMISILGDYYYEFPRKKKLKLRLKDMLEEVVDEKYYLSDKMIAYMLGKTKGAKGKFPRKERFLANINRETQELAVTITTNAGNRPTDNFFLEDTICLNSKVNGKQPSLQDRVYDTKGIATAITTSFLPSYVVKDTRPDTLGVVVPEATKKGYSIAKDGDGVYLDRPHQKRGVVQKGMIQTIKTQNGDVGVVDNLRIRKLTPKETWRLMGFTDEDFEKAQKVNSDTQLYKQAGNSIVVQVLEEIFKELI